MSDRCLFHKVVFVPLVDAGNRLASALKSVVGNHPEAEAAIADWESRKPLGYELDPRDGRNEEDVA